MRSNRKFAIPFVGLPIGMHQFDFDINDSFFETFEFSPVKSGNLKVLLNFDKKHDHFILNFESSGTVRSLCDRCTADIDLPVQSEVQYIVKFGEDLEENGEVVYIDINESHLDVKNMIYETILLKIPMIKVYDCSNTDPLPCNNSVLKYLENEETSSAVNPIWGQLKDIKIDKN